AAVSVVVVPHQTGSITNTVGVTSDAVDTTPDDNAAILVGAIQPLANFVLQQEASARSIVVNNALTYTIRLTPVAPYGVPQTVLTDWLPDWVDFVSLTTSQGTWTNQVGEVTCELGLIPQGQTAIVAITVVPRLLG